MLGVLWGSKPSCASSSAEVWLRMILSKESLASLNVFQGDFFTVLPLGRRLEHPVSNQTIVMAMLIPALFL